MKNIIGWLKDDDAENYVGWMWAGILSMVLFVKSWLIVYGNALLSKSVVIILLNIRGLIRWKVARLSNASRNFFDAGRVSSLLMVDVFRMDACFMRAYHLGTAPSIFIFLTVYIILELGWVGVLAPTTMLVMMIIQRYLNVAFLKANRAKLNIAGNRSSKVEELLKAMKIVKFNAWEKVLEKIIMLIRKSEQKFIFNILM